MEPQSIQFESEAGFRALFKYATIGIVVVDDLGQIVISNPHTEKLFGYSNVELMGQSIETLIPEKFQNQHVNHRARYLKNPKPQPMSKGLELSAVRKDGSKFSVEVSLGSYSEDSKRLVVCFVTDISERKDYAQKLERAVDKKTKQLKAALEQERLFSDLKSKFISIASHEFRTPLSAIMSSASLIDRYIDREQPEAQKKHTKRIRNSVRHLTCLLSDFLSLEKLDEGMVKNQASNFDLESFIYDILGDFKGILKPWQEIKSNLNFTQNNVKLDQKLMRAVMTNLISNAIKYSDEGTEINIEVCRKPEKLLIKVQDHGLGIPIDEQQQLFSRFFRASNVTSIKGTGLGLNIVKRYLEIMGGSISFRSVPREGSTFNLEIPLESN